MDQTERNRMPDGFPPIKEPKFPYLPNIFAIYVATVLGVLTINQWPSIVHWILVLSGIAYDVWEQVWHYVMSIM